MNNHSAETNSLLTHAQNRADVFTNLLNSGDVTNVSVDTTQTEKLLRLLDTVVIRLEGGTDEDLKVLDEKPVEPKQFEPPPARSTAISKSNDDDAKPTGRPNNPFAKKVDDDAATPKGAGKPAKKNDDDDEEDWDSDDNKNADDKKKSGGGDEDDEWGESKADKKESGDKDEWDDDPASPDQKDQPSSPNDKQMDWDEDQSKPAADDTPNVEESNPRKRSRSESSSSSSSSSDSDGPSSPKPTKSESVDDEIAEPKDEEMKTVEETGAAEPVADPDAAEEEKVDDGEAKKPDDSDKDDSKTEDKVETIDLDKESDTKEEGPTHKALHRTSSIFLRNLAPTITKAEVEAMCKRVMSNGFLRVAIADPLVERRWFRRGWVTFERDVNIKEICWNLNNIRLRDCELGAIVRRAVHIRSNIIFVFANFEFRFR